MHSTKHVINQLWIMVEYRWSSVWSLIIAWANGHSVHLKQAMIKGTKSGSPDWR